MALQLSGITISGGVSIFFDLPTVTASYLVVAGGAGGGGYMAVVVEPADY